MAIVKINAIEVDPERAGELEERFANRVGEVEQQPGFLSYELLRPIEGESRYFVYTRWESEEHFQGWVQSESFRRGHAQAAADRGQKPVAHGSSVLGFEIVQQVQAPSSAASAGG